ncbi:uncharacterized protein C17orf50 homolog [Dromiciops gliroides]|uniref:uncharacterized protein C17orf50 homolog n=1 Tax=Dromiciops gliroides TaxID=33562 RepID=UPI001CC6E79E|nr:uncharacterized protein C17orf50 homolog [Dromiciops gliroides]
MDKRGNGLKIPLWKKEPEELLDDEVEDDENEEEEDSDEKDSDEAEKASDKEGEYWESGQELQDGDGKDKGSVSYCPLRQESSAPEVSALRRSESGFWTWLSPLTLLSSLAFPMDRKRTQPGQVCLLEKQRSNEVPCSRCEILFCRKCETLHCDPNYVEHCILDHWEGGFIHYNHLHRGSIMPCPLIPFSLTLLSDPLAGQWPSLLTQRKPHLVPPTVELVTMINSYNRHRLYGREM